MYVCVCIMIHNLMDRAKGDKWFIIMLSELVLQCTDHVKFKSCSRENRNTKKCQLKNITLKQLCLKN